MAQRSLLESLTQRGYARRLDPEGLVDILHRRPRRQPMATMALLDFVVDSPSRMVELALETGRRAAVVGSGRRSGSVEHPALEAIASVMTLGLAGRISQQPHRIAVVFTGFSTAPDWGLTVCRGLLMQTGKRITLAGMVLQEGTVLLPEDDRPAIASALAWLAEELRC